MVIRIWLYRFHRYVEFKEKQKVPHSYSRAEENARFANGVRDDEIKKDYINPEIALSFRPIGTVTSGGLATGLFLPFPGALRALGLRQITVFHAIIGIAVAHGAKRFVIKADAAGGFLEFF